jgi:hypothetical protein
LSDHRVQIARVAIACAVAAAVLRLRATLWNRAERHLEASNVTLELLENGGLGESSYKLCLWRR